MQQLERKLNRWPVRQTALGRGREHLFGFVNMLAVVVDYPLLEVITLLTIFFHHTVQPLRVLPNENQ